jgi:3-oxoadipate enol-lactonase
MPDQFASIDDIRLRYRLEGKPGAPVIMMAHAMGTNLHLWDWQMPALTDAFQVLRYDWRGHGLSDAPSGNYTLAQFVADAVGLIDRLQLERVHWVGISTGGMIGQGVAIAHGDRLLSLSLCNTMSQASEWYRGWALERQRVVRQSGMMPIWEMTKRLWFTDDYVATEGPDYVTVRDEFVKTKVAGYLGGTAAVADLAYRDQLHHISVPTHIIAAGADPVTPIDHSRMMQERIEGSSLTIIEGQRHFSNVEVPDQFNAPLRAFLDAL